MNILQLLLRLICNKLYKEKVIAPPVIYGRISRERLKGLILEVFPDAEDIHIGRMRYNMTTVAEAERFFREDGTDKMTYGEDFPKCIDFTRRILGNMTIKGWWSIPKGDIWLKINGGHSVVVMALYSSETDLRAGLYLAEGQNDIIETAEIMFEDYDYILSKW